MKNKNHMSAYFDGAEIKVYKTNETIKLNALSKKENMQEIIKYIHTHFTYEIFFVTEGKFTIVSENFVRTFEKSVIVIPPQFKHYTIPESDNCYCLLFSVEKYKLENINENTITTIPITDEISFYIKRLSEKNTIKTKKSIQTCKLITEVLFNELSELIDSDKSEIELKQFASENISKIERFINQNLNRRITLTDVSKYVFLSTRQVSRIIEKAYGKNFAELVTEKRLTSAEMLLKSSDMKIAEVASTTFPENANYFYTLFKKRYGMTPLNYRKQNKNIRREDYVN